MKSITKMSVDKETVAKIANLARIEVSDNELENTMGELNNILDWVEQLSEVNTDGIEAMTSVVAADLPLREDKITDGGYREKVIKNAPLAEHGFFAVPKVIE
jgi:aspartyl-tRNA(Asn)/glutamyl-tRNA(Gln) amidotransferase subunit C|tara:strand:+ start:485 stop:790 length:306 start_codon:yes stop_codon:yes gene_type:complete